MPWPEMPANEAATATLSQSKQWLRANIKKGAICPCCTKVAKVYKRKLHASMAYALLLLARDTGPGEWVHLFNFLKKRDAKHGDAAQLRHWGLIVEGDGELEDGNPRTGHYRITDHGRNFVAGQVSVAKHAKTYDNRVLSFGTKLITIHEALGDAFSYSELMRGFQ